MIHQVCDLDIYRSFNLQEFPDRRGFFTGHRIPLELFGEDTLRHIQLIGDVKKEKNAEGRADTYNQLIKFKHHTIMQLVLKIMYIIWMMLRSP